MTVIPTEPDEMTRFGWYTWDLSPFTEDGVWIDVERGGNGRLCVKIVVTETTTARELRRAESLALQWRDRLIAFQGRQPNPWMLAIQAQVDAGKTHAEVARLANARVAAWLQEYNGLPDKGTYAARSLLGNARELLAALYVKQDVIDAAIASDAPFPADYPVSRYEIKYALRQWRRGAKT